MLRVEAQQPVLQMEGSDRILLREEIDCDPESGRRGQRQLS
jgi:hypothetical protein